VAEADERLRGIERQLELLLWRVDRIEHALAHAGIRPVSEAAPAPEPAPEPARPPVAAPPPPPPPAPPPPSEPPAPRAPAVSFEDLLGGRVLAWVGGSAVVLGVVFFVAYAVNRGYIDERTRVVLAFLGSTALLVAGVWLHERQGRTQASLAAVAAAIASLYASLTAATNLYDLIEPSLGLAVALLIGAVATAVAVRWDSPVVAGLGIVGALLSPVLVDAGTSRTALAFMGVALVSAVGVLLWRKWDWLAAAAFVVSALQLLAWIDDNYRERLGEALAVLVMFWVLYVVAAIGYELRVPVRELRPSSATLLLADAVLIAGAGWLVLDDTGHGGWATAWVISLAALHVVLGSLSLRERISDEIAVLLIAVGMGLSAIGLALALDGPALVSAWSVEAVLLAWLGRRTGDLRASLGSLVFVALAAGHTLLIDARPDLLSEESEGATPAVAVTLVAIAAGACAWLHRDRWPEVRDPLLALATVALLYLPPIALDGTAVVAAWAVEAVVAAYLAQRLDERAAGAAGAALALAAGHTLVFEAPPVVLRDGADDLGAALLAIALVVAAAVACVRLADERWRLPVEIVAGVGAVYLPSVAIVDLTAAEGADPGQTPQVLLSAFWSVLGLAALVVGLVRDIQRLRLAGLALLGLAVAKVFVYDLSELDEIYRVLSFVALGLLLLAGAFAYQRIRLSMRDGGEA
jgi:uncharacterized membrane protein